MSSEYNHKSSFINLNNYEEFFILYIDGELNDAQAVMVENFIALHPHLQYEMNLLMNTKLPVEDMDFDNRSLLSHNMHSQTLQEELLLFIDDELPADRKKMIELEIASNVSYQKQLQLLTATKLNGAEKIVHPHKKELYRSTKKVLLFPPWMRIAVVFLLIGSMGVIYLVQQGKSLVVNTAALKLLPKKPTPIVNNVATVKTIASPKQQVISNAPGVSNETEKTFVRISNQNKKGSHAPIVLANEQTINANDIAVLRGGERQNTINYSITSNYAKPHLQHAQISNATSVTSGAADAYNLVTASVQSTVFTDVESNNRKGSLKSFLRKAGRTITRRAGIDSENEDDETLIGVVAVKLK